MTIGHLSHNLSVDGLCLETSIQGQKFVTFVHTSFQFPCKIISSASHLLTALLTSKMNFRTKSQLPEREVNASKIRGRHVPFLGKCLP